jgi:hypothetical protein
MLQAEIATPAMYRAGTRVAAFTSTSEPYSFMARLRTTLIHALQFTAQLHQHMLSAISSVPREVQ